MTKLSEQQEKFCQNLVQGMSQQEAYLKAGYNCDEKHARTAASRLVSTNVNVKSRIDALRAQHASEAGVTTVSLTKRLMALADKAENAGDLTNARQALMDSAKLNGLIVDRSKVDQNNTNYVVSDKEMTEDEWASTYSNENQTVN